ncbi:hypothetical protein AOA57_16065 [Pseudomonas sp. 2588-5]|jgi:hypothetical protein|nr:hypothetical protein AOA57_16065 [Pseudomonas sp. 2588-5]
MIGLIPNIFAAATALNLLDFRRPHQASSGQAIDIGQCPAVSDIQSKPYTDPDLPPPYGEGYKYSAHTRGRTWKGQTAGTDDDYLAPRYALKAETITQTEGRLRCDYGGKTVVEEGVTATPYLRLNSQ